jgi:adenine-specific DNA-methyltransferase
MLKYGIDLILAIVEYEINDKKVYSIGHDFLLICLDNNTKKIAISLIGFRNKLSPETVPLVFKNTFFQGIVIKLR